MEMLHAQKHSIPLLIQQTDCTRPREGIRYNRFVLSYRAVVKMLTEWFCQT